MPNYISNDWKWRRKLTLQSSAIDSNIDDLEIVIRENQFSGSNIFTEAESDGGDIRFATDAEGTNLLPINIIDFDTINSELTISTNLLNLISSSNREFWIFWGRNGEAQPPEFWKEGHNRVFSDHCLLSYDMTVTSGTDEDDRTDWQRDGEYENGLPSTVAGAIGPAKNFDGVDDKLIYFQDDTEIATDAFTWTAWIRPTWVSGVPGYKPTVFGLRSGSTTWFSVHFDNNYNSVITWNGSSNGTYTTSLSQNTDYHIAVIWDGGSSVRIVLNGVDLGTQSVTPNLSNPTVNFNIGTTGSAEWWIGYISHVRLYDEAFSVDKVQALYRIESAPGTYITSGDDEVFASGFPNNHYGFYSLEIDSTNIDSDLIDNVSMLDHRAFSASQLTKIFAQASATGQDLKIGDNSGNIWPSQTTYMDTVNERFTILYKPPTTTSASNTALRFYFGGNAIPFSPLSDYGSDSVWSAAAYQAAWIGNYNMSNKGLIEGFSFYQFGLQNNWDADLGVFNDAGSTPAGDTDSVQEWHDQKSDVVISQPTAANKPVYNTNAVEGHASIEFDGVNDVLLNTSDTITAGSIYLVLKMKDGTGYTNLDTIISNDNDQQNFRRHNTTETYRGNNNTDINDLSHPDGRLVIDGIVWDTFILNDSFMVLEIQADSVNTYTNNFTLGRANTLPGRYAKFEISQILIYDHVLPAGASINVRSYLAHKFGNQALSPSGPSTGTSLARVQPTKTPLSTQNEGQAWDFDPANDDYLLHNVDDISNFVNDFSVFYYGKSDTVTGVHAVYSQTGTGGFLVGIRDDDLIFTTQGVKEYNLGGNEVTSGAWMAILHSMDSSNDVDFYKNGVDLGQVTHGFPGNIGTSNMRVGSSASSIEEWDGSIGALIVFNTAVGAAQAKALTKNFHDPVGYYTSAELTILNISKVNSGIITNGRVNGGLIQ